MAERVTVIVRPSQANEDVLSVQDAMHQVLDAFVLLDDTDEIVWRLVSASANSPLNVVAEATSVDEALDITARAHEQTTALGEDLEHFVRGELPESWGSRKIEAARRLLNRTKNGIGSTEITLGNTSITISSAIHSPKGFEEGAPYFKHVERGSIEGSLIEIATYNGKPAIYVEERKSKKRIVCVISEEMRDKIAAAIHPDDVWDHRRLTVRGKLIFGGPEKLRVVESESVDLIKPSREVSARDLSDKDFTSGLSITEYLERLREGELG
ncbi:MAG TPA: hypothetical protein VMG98_02160 [Verrucomicrobiae bacterium]|nr:hypothetical protein [Verrucomicrobiae bacterium]